MLLHLRSRCRRSRWRPGLLSPAALNTVSCPIPRGKHQNWWDHLKWDSDKHSYQDWHRFYQIHIMSTVLKEQRDTLSYQSACWQNNAVLDVKLQRTCSLRKNCQNTPLWVDFLARKCQAFQTVQTVTRGIVGARVDRDCSVTGQLIEAELFDYFKRDRKIPVPAQLQIKSSQWLSSCEMLGGPSAGVPTQTSFSPFLFFLFSRFCLQHPANQKALSLTHPPRFHHKHDQPYNINSFVPPVTSVTEPSLGLHFPLLNKD